MIWNFLKQALGLQGSTDFRNCVFRNAIRYSPNNSLLGKNIKYLDIACREGTVEGRIVDVDGLSELKMQIFLHKRSYFLGSRQNDLWYNPNSILTPDVLEDRINMVANMPHHVLKHKLQRQHQQHQLISMRQMDGGYTHVALDSDRSSNRKHVDRQNEPNGNKSKNRQVFNAETQKEAQRLKRLEIQLDLDSKEAESKLSDSKMKEELRQRETLSDFIQRTKVRILKPDRIHNLEDDKKDLSNSVEEENVLASHTVQTDPETNHATYSVSKRHSQETKSEHRKIADGFISLLIPSHLSLKEKLKFADILLNHFVLLPKELMQLVDRLLETEDFGDNIAGNEVHLQELNNTKTFKTIVGDLENRWSEMSRQEILECSLLFKRLNISVMHEPTIELTTENDLSFDEIVFICQSWTELSDYSKALLFKYFHSRLDEPGSVPVNQNSIKQVLDVNCLLYKEVNALEDGEKRNYLSKVQNFIGSTIYDYGTVERVFKWYALLEQDPGTYEIGLNWLEPLAESCRQFAVENMTPAKMSLLSKYRSQFNNENQTRLQQLAVFFIENKVMSSYRCLCCLHEIGQQDLSAFGKSKAVEAIKLLDNSLFVEYFDLVLQLRSRFDINDWFTRKTVANFLTLLQNGYQDILVDFLRDVSNYSLPVDILEMLQKQGKLWLDTIFIPFANTENAAKMQTSFELLSLFAEMLPYEILRHQNLLKKIYIDEMKTLSTCQLSHFLVLNSNIIEKLYAGSDHDNVLLLKLIYRSIKIKTDVTESEPTMLVGPSTLNKFFPKDPLAVNIAWETLHAKTIQDVCDIVIRSRSHKIDSKMLKSLLHHLILLVSESGKSFDSMQILSALDMLPADTGIDSITEFNAVFHLLLNEIAVEEFSRCLKRLKSGVGGGGDSGTSCETYAWCLEQLVRCGRAGRGITNVIDVVCSGKHQDDVKAAFEGRKCFPRVQQALIELRRHACIMFPEVYTTGNDIMKFDRQEVMSFPGMTDDMEGQEGDLTALNSVMQLNQLRPGINYIMVSVEGPQNEPLFTVSVDVDGQTFTGQGNKKKTAKNAAAHLALQSLGLGSSPETKVEEDQGSEPVSDADLTAGNDIMKFDRQEVMSFPGMTDDMEAQEGDLTARLNSMVQLNKLRPGINYKMVSVEGPEHEPLFTVSVDVDGQTFTGQGSRKKTAKNAAAHLALQSLGLDSSSETEVEEDQGSEPVSDADLTAGSQCKVPYDFEQTLMDLLGNANYVERGKMLECGLIADYAFCMDSEGDIIPCNAAGTAESEFKQSPSTCDRCMPQSQSDVTQGPSAFSNIDNDITADDDNLVNNAADYVGSRESAEVVSQDSSAYNSIENGTTANVSCEEIVEGVPVSTDLVTEDRDIRFQDVNGEDNSNDSTERSIKRYVVLYRQEDRLDVLFNRDPVIVPTTDIYYQKLGYSVVSVTAQEWNSIANDDKTEFLYEKIITADQPVYKPIVSPYNKFESHDWKKLLM